MKKFMLILGLFISGNLFGQKVKVLNFAFAIFELQPFQWRFNSVYQRITSQFIFEYGGFK